MTAHTHIFYKIISYNLNTFPLSSADLFIFYSDLIQCAFLSFWKDTVISYLSASANVQELPRKAETPVLAQMSGRPNKNLDILTETPQSPDSTSKCLCLCSPSASPRQNRTAAQWPISNPPLKSDRARPSFSQSNFLKALGLSVSPRYGHRQQLEKLSEE